MHELTKVELIISA